MDAENSLLGVLRRECVDAHSCLRLLLLGEERIDFDSSVLPSEDTCTVAETSLWWLFLGELLEPTTSVEPSWVTELLRVGLLGGESKDDDAMTEMGLLVLAGGAFMLNVSFFVNSNVVDRQWCNCA